MYAKYFKRIIDCILSLIGLIVLSPIFLILIILGAISMKGNPFFTQLRPGKNEKIFKLIKFRTMDNRKDAEGNLLPDEVRLNKYGKFLRSTSLDELPELINVIKGDMSLVGPRPLYPFYLPYYYKEENLRHTVRGGITGLAQINGRALCRWNDRFAYDVKYVKEMSFVNDIKILWRTFFKVAGQDDIGIPSVTEEGGLHIVRELQQPEKVKYVEDIAKKYGMKNVPHFNKK